MSIVESLNKNGYDIAGHQDKNHKRMLPHPLHCICWSPVPRDINLEQVNKQLANQLSQLKEKHTKDKLIAYERN